MHKYNKNQRILMQPLSSNKIQFEGHRFIACADNKFKTKLNSYFKPIVNRIYLAYSFSA